MEKYCISVDWLQVYCLVTRPIAECESYDYSAQGESYNIHLSANHPPMFNELWEIRHKSSGMKVATMQTSPRSPKLNSRMCLLRLENRVLYSTTYIHLLYSIMESMGLIYKGITRIDLCYDCNKYAGGRSPARFINQFLSRQEDQDGYIYLNGIKMFSAYGTKSRTSSSKVTSISFGSDKSKIRSYIYDKTKELQEVKDKPWIREYWKENGLISEDKEHVFRSEISIKAEGTDLLNMSTGELFRLDPSFLVHRDTIEKLFHFYAHKYFDFRIKCGQKLRRNFKSLYLFECKVISDTCKPIYINKSADTGRMERICLNKLERLSSEYSDLGEHYRASLEVAMRFLLEVSGVKRAIVEQRIREQYLNSLRGRKWIDSDSLAYLLVVENCRQLQIEAESCNYFDASHVVDDYVPLPPPLLYSEEEKHANS